MRIAPKRTDQAAPPNHYVATAHNASPTGQDRLKQTLWASEGRPASHPASARQEPRALGAWPLAASSRKMIMLFRTPRKLMNLNRLAESKDQVWRTPQGRTSPSTKLDGEATGPCFLNLD